MTAATDLQSEARRVLAALPRRGRSPRRVLRDAWAALPVGRSWTESRPLPGVILAGTMRGGTTSLFEYLAGHPQIVPARRKEVHFFDLEHRRGAGWYRWQFHPRRDVALPRFESTPYYMFEPRAPARMRALVPDARVVFLLRDPVERAFSHYRKNRRDGREPLDFADALAAEDERLAGEEERMLADPAYVSPLHQYYSYRRRGHYAEQLARWREHYPDRQLLVLDAGRLFASPRETLAAVTAFLGLDPWQPAALPPHNAGHCDRPLPAAVRGMLEAHFAPHERRLESLIGWCPSRSRVAA